MLLFGHIGVTLGVFFVLGIFHTSTKKHYRSKYLVIGALLPDLVDKPLGMSHLFFYSCKRTHYRSYSIVLSYSPPDRFILVQKKRRYKDYFPYCRLFLPPYGRSNVGNP